MVILKENSLTREIYLLLRKKAGWEELSNEQADKALAASLYNVVAYKDGKPCGMGRVVGDGAVICYIQDLIVNDEVRKQGIGRKIMENLIRYVRSIQLEGTQMKLALMCAKGREGFYEKCGFMARPTDELGPGMITYFDK